MRGEEEMLQLKTPRLDLSPGWGSVLSKIIFNKMSLFDESLDLDLTHITPSIG